MKPLAIDLFAGLGGWTEGLLAEGYYVVGFDIERHVYGEERYPAQLVVQDVLTLHGSQFKDAALIVASPPCQEYSYMAMPWSRAKAKAAAIRADETGAELERLNRLFNACFRIQREACEAAGHHIPMVVENVRGAIPWVGRSRWNFGSYHIWGDVPALMPPVRRYGKQDGDKRTGRTMCYPPGSANPEKVKGRTGKLHWQDDAGAKVPGFRFDGSGGSFQTASVEGMKTQGHINKRDGHAYSQRFTNPAEFVPPGEKVSQSARKRASAMIAKIPFALSQHIARVFKPRERIAA